ncbi:hypothetical protein BN14_04436 [Rhizoctonia solani AG-1 IB]|uniref:galacturonan 1,4-alpha-galacturonidase n=1 Tax=Thanatephorus cucumeris (strain AG1-IB / isolate 7/3/14) TaxID=1108050 RepID=M5C3E1_THACB|nr:hypothetical protein BN14_04436 [Rhizoctonia solani AG-1 IB]
MIVAAALALLPLVSAYSKTFVVPHTPGKDDSPAVVAAIANYSSDSLIIFKKGVTYNLWTPINFGTLNNCEVAFEGNATYPTSIAAVQAEVAKSTFSGHWIKIAGTNVTLRGTTDPNWGWIDSHGQQWWDAVQQTNRPHGISFVVTNGVVKDMKLWQPIAWNFLFNGGKNIHAFNNRIHAVSATKAFPFNTDGFAAGGTNLLIENNHIVNGDDCITVGSGANGVHFRNNYCEGGHGLSIGSLGKGGAVASVQNILFENVVMKNHLYGARFKSWTGGNGIAKNITWRNIVLENVPFPIYVTQNYWDQNLGPKPTTDSPNNTHIEDMIFDNFSGTQLDIPYVEGSCVSNPCWYSVANATGKEIVIFDLYHSTTRNIVAKRISGLRTLNNIKPAVMCDPTAIDNDVGTTMDKHDTPFYMREESGKNVVPDTFETDNSEDSNNITKIEIGSIKTSPAINYATYKALGKGLSSSANMTPDGRIVITLDLHKKLPDLPKDYANPVREKSR